MQRYEQRVQHLLKGQQAPFINGQRTILFRCPQCQRNWLMQGGDAQLHLTPEELIHWAQRLHADLSDLPLATCRLCTELLLGGQFAVDEYPSPAGQIRGYGYSWEGVDPPAHFLVAVLHLEWALSLPLGQCSHHMVTDAVAARAVLNWFSETTRQRRVRPSPASAALIRLLNRLQPVHAGVAGWVWRGAAWKAFCDPLKAEAVVLFAQARPPASTFLLKDALAVWRQVVHHVLAHGGIAGEEPGSDASS